MKLSTRSQYGLRALISLSRHPGNRNVSLRLLAEENNIPYKFLEQLFAVLKNTGIVISHAGPQGGYRLARPASEITFGQVIRALDGTLAPVPCVSKIAYEPCSCPDEKSCSLRKIMNEVRDAIVNIVDTRTLADLDQEGVTQ